MENKTFKFGDTEFTYIEDRSLLKKKKNRLLKKYFSLESEFLSDIDTKLIDKYDNRITELQTGYETAKDVKHKEDLKIKLDKVKEDKANDKKVQAIIKEKNACTGLLLTELCEDAEYMKPFLKEVLQGDHSKLDFDSPEIVAFNLGVINNFFTFMDSSSPK